MSRGCMDREGVTSGQSFASSASTCHIVIACRVLLNPSSPWRTTSFAIVLNHGVTDHNQELLHISVMWGMRGPQGIFFDAWFIIHGLIIQSFRHLPGGDYCSTLPSTPN